MESSVLSVASLETNAFMSLSLSQSMANLRIEKHACHRCIAWTADEASIGAHLISKTPSREPGSIQKMPIAMNIRSGQSMRCSLSLSFPQCILPKLAQMSCNRNPLYRDNGRLQTIRRCRKRELLINLLFFDDGLEV